MIERIDILSSLLLCCIQGQIHNWLDRYFPVFLTVFKDREGKAALQLLKLNALPHELIKLPDEEILAHLKKAVQKGMTLKSESEVILEAVI